MIKTIKKCFEICGDYKIRILVYDVILIMSFIINMVGVILTSKLIDLICDNNRNKFYVCLLMVFIIQMFEILINYVLFYMKMHIEKEIRVRSKVKIFRLSQEVPDFEWEKRKITNGKIENVFYQDVNQITTVIFVVIEIINKMIYLVVIASVLCRINIFLFFGITISLPFCFFSANHIEKKVKEERAEILKKTDELWLLFSECIENIHELRANMGSKVLCNIFTKRISDIKEQSYKNESKKYALATIVSFVGFLNYIFIILFGSLLVWKNQITLGSLVACIMLGKMYADTFSTLMLEKNSLRQICLNASRALEILNMSSSIIPKEKNIECVQSTRINNLCVKKGDKELFRNISFDFVKGKAYILRGINGCGKTTLLNIMAMNDQPTSGNIEKNNHDVTALEREIYRGDVLFQHNNPAIISVSLRDNITMYSNKNIVDKEIEKIAVENELDFAYENGKINLDFTPNIDKKLSAGQKQRIAICRALISEKNIVLLDEPLSNLDSGKSKTAEKQIIELAKEKIVVVATHEGFKNGISLPIFLN